MKTNKSIFKFFSVALCVIITCSTAGCNKTENLSKVSFSKTASSDDKNWNIASGEEIKLENNKISFELDSSNGHFIVIDKTNGNQYHSVPKDDVLTFSDEDAARIKSEITVTYFEKQSVAYYLYSSTDCVDLGQFEVKYNDASIRVYYHLGAVERFIPTIIDKDTFENKIVAKLNNSAKERKINRFYTLYSKSEENDDFDQMKEKYPAISKDAFYILKIEEMNDNELSAVYEYMDIVGFTESDYEKILKKYNLKSENVDSQVGFTIPVEYNLTNDGFSAQILSDKIKESSKSFVLQSVDFLEYFACGKETQEGYFFVPDGSGSLIPFNSTVSGAFNQEYYGGDFCKKSSKKDQLTKNLSLPVFGMNKVGGNFFAIIENGAEVATLCAKPYNESSPQNHIYIKFNYREIETSDDGENELNSILNIFSGHLLRTHPKIKFTLLDDSQSDYISMAKYYRSYLCENGMLKEISSLDNAAPIYLDFLCLTSGNDTFMGMTYTKETVLSTLEEITDTVNFLYQNGFNKINVRLLGFGENGLENGVPNQFTLSSKVGSKSELLDLAKLLEQKGGKLFLETNMQFAYEDQWFDGFSQKNDSSHRLDRSIVYNGNYDLVTREYNDSSLKRFFISPSLYYKFTKDYISSVNKELPQKSFALSFGSIGNYLGGDYTLKTDYDRTDSAKATAKALKYASESFDIMVDVGNSYVLPYTSDLLNVSVTSSRFDVESMSVPFFSAVIHGSISYAAAPENLSGDIKTALLQSLENGASPYMVCITKDDSNLIDTPYQKSIYSLNTSRLSEFTERWQGAYKFISSVSNEEIIHHNRLQNGVHKTEFSNGKSVIVNYNNYNVKIGDLSISAEGYSLQ